WTLIQTTFRTYLSEPARDTTPEQEAFAARVPEQQRANVERVLGSYRGARRSYRIGLVIQLAYGLMSEGHLDLTKRPEGARGPKGVAGRTGKLLADNHIVSVEDAYQNIAKNSENMARGNFLEFDSFLRWASQKSRTKDDL